jgi:formate--tetrahydrofolate ligase
MQRYGVPVVVAINAFSADTAAEISLVQELCAQKGVQAINTTVWADGGAGGEELARAVLTAVDQPSTFKPLYDSNSSIQVKLATIVQKVYGGSGVEFSHQAQINLKVIKKNGWENLPICVAKTQYSFSDDATKLGAPTNFTIHVSEIIPKLGAGFLVVKTGAILTMPGLPKVPAANNIDVDDDGVISGLF